MVESMKKSYFFILVLFLLFVLVFPYLVHAVNESVSNIEIRFVPVEDVRVYKDNILYSNLNGLEISSDAKSLVYENKSSDKIYLLFNGSSNSSIDSEHVFLAYYDASFGKNKLFPGFPNQRKEELNISIDNTNYLIGILPLASTNDLLNMTIYSFGTTSAILNFTNRSSAISGTIPKVVLGEKESIAEDADISTVINGTLTSISLSNEESTTDSGILFLSPKINADFDKVIIKILSFTPLPTVTDYNPENHYIPPDFSYALVGKTHIITVFVDTLDDKWSFSDIAYAMNEVVKATEWLQIRAPINANLSFTINYYWIEANASSSVVKNYGAGVEDNVTRYLGYADTDNDSTAINDMLFYHKELYGADNVIVLFTFVKSGSGNYAVPGRGVATLDLYSASYGRTLRAGYYIHEALHLFGAEDEASYCDLTDCTGNFSWNYSNKNCFICNPGCTDHCTYFPYNYSNPLYVCIMLSPDSDYICPYTRGQIGWGDHDNDGVLDPLDNCPYDSGYDKNGCPKLFELKINFPENKTCGSRYIHLNISTIETVGLIEYSDNGGRFTRLCSDCQSYNRSKTFRNGSHNLTVKAVAYDGKEYYDNVLFTVDSTKPRIMKTSPKTKEYVKGLVNFTVKYTEDNLKNVILVYGNSFTEKMFTGCESGRNKECSAEKDLSSFDGTWINYYFIVGDEVHNVTSKNYTIFVDSTAPLITVNKPLNYTSYGNRVPLDIKISEEVELKKSIDGSRFTTMCSRCSSYNRTSYFKDGEHNITFIAVDKSGNEGRAFVVFSVNNI